jgi:hypothetical protein
VPTEIFDTVVTAEVNEETIPVPANCIHNPVPTAGVFADKVTLLAQTVCETPAFDVVGI